jgi:ATP-dependent Clp protease adaptor protein ClpS
MFSIKIDSSYRAGETETAPEISTETDVLTEENPEKSLILFNDDVNTFDWVIQCLIEICEHEVEQAEQCTYIIHYKGKCDVKHGSFEDLEPRLKELHRRGLSAEIR